MRTMYWLAFIAGMLAWTVATAQPVTVGGQWTDPTTPGSNYVPLYDIECRTNGIASYTDVGLPGPSFSAPMDVEIGTDVVDCQARSVNTVVPSNPVEGEWSAWLVAIEAQAPSAPTGFMFWVVVPSP